MKKKILAVLKRIGKISLVLSPFAVVLLLFVAFRFDWLGIFPHNLDVEHRGVFGDSFGVLTSLFSALGFAGVMVTMWMQQQQINMQKRERHEELEERRSLFNLKSSIEAYELARNLLANQINHRATWIQAGRLLGHARELGAGVTIEEHQRVLEFKRLEYRSFFSDLIEGKPAAYFYGVTDYDTLDAAAAASSLPKTSDGNNISDVRELNEPSLRAVWLAGQWPEPYIDPLHTKFSDLEKHSLQFQSEGMLEFLQHKEQWSSVGGVLHPRSNPRKEENLT